jgi:hypothetical protein
MTETTPDIPGTDTALDLDADWQDWLDLRAAGITQPWDALRQVAALAERALSALAAAREELAEAKREIRTLTDSDDAQVVIAQGELAAARAEADKLRPVAEAAKAAVAYILETHPQIRDAQRGWFHPSTLRLVAAVDKLAAVPGDGEQAATTCGHTYTGNVGEFTCDLYAPHPGKRHWNSLAEFAWTDEVKA